MINKVKMHVTGLEDIQRRFKLMEKKAKPLARKAMRQGAKIFAKAAKGLVVKGETGDLKKSIKVRSGRRSRRWVSIIVQAGQDLNEPLTGRAPYAMQIEHGAPHRGIPAKPFMRPAFDANGDSVRDKIQDAIIAGILDFEKPPEVEEEGDE